MLGQHCGLRPTQKMSGHCLKAVLIYVRSSGIRTGVERDSFEGLHVGESFALAAELVYMQLATRLITLV